MNTKKWESIISASSSNFSLTRRGRFLRWKTLGNVSGQQQGGRGSYYAAAWVFQCVHEIRARLCWRENRVEGGEKKNEKKKKKETTTWRKRAQRCAPCLARQLSDLILRKGFQS